MGVPERASGSDKVPEDPSRRRLQFARTVARQRFEGEDLPKNLFVRTAGPVVRSVVRIVVIDADPVLKRLTDVVDAVRNGEDSPDPRRSAPRSAGQKDGRGYRTTSLEVEGVGRNRRALG